MNINYKDDCIITEEEEVTLNTLLERVRDEAEETEIDGKGEEQDEGRSFESDIEFEDGKLLVNVSSRFYYTEESYD
jgi:antitoxin component YwqK of YwqJK toxin-antitoxin module